MQEEYSLAKMRCQYTPQLPMVMKDVRHFHLEPFGGKTSSVADAAALQKLFPHLFGSLILEGKQGGPFTSKVLRVGVVLSGGQAAGGHNVITGLFDALKQLNPESVLIGFLNGPSGIINNRACLLEAVLLASYRNMGGFDLIGSGRTKIETPEQLAMAKQVVDGLHLDGLVVVGGDDSNTNAAVLAEYFLENKCRTAVVGVPKTIDGDLKSKWVDASFGFDTACKIYSELIGNICRDALSAKKYYHFIRLMGRSASHVTLECALQTHPNFTFIGEEIREKGQSLEELVQTLCEGISYRAAQGMNYGVVLIPEGLLEFIPEFKTLIEELNTLLNEDFDKKTLYEKLTPESLKCLKSIPEKIQDQLLFDRDDHGNVRVSQIETEQLLMKAVEERLKKTKQKVVFNPLHHFFGYEGRCGFPSNFDSQYCYALGRVAAVLISAGKTGYMACVKDLVRPVEEWKAYGLPLTMMMNIEKRKGKEKAVIQKALVDLNGSVFHTLIKHRDEWSRIDAYRYPGAIQYFGPKEISDQCTKTLELESAMR